MRILREPVRVSMHLNGGYTRVLVEASIGSGGGDGGVSWDIPTDRIPVAMRRLGSRFLLATPLVDDPAGLSPEALREALDDVVIEPLVGRS